MEDLFCFLIEQNGCHAFVEDSKPPDFMDILFRRIVSKYVDEDRFSEKWVQRVQVGIHSG